MPFVQVRMPEQEFTVQGSLLPERHRLVSLAEVPVEDAIEVFEGKKNE